MAARVATAAALIVALLAALFLLPRPWLAGLIALLVAAAGFEWARLCRLQAGAAWIYATLIAAAFLALFIAGAERMAFAAGCIFWFLVAPLWLARGMHAAHRLVLLGAGFLVLVPASLAMTFVPPLPLLLVLALVWAADTAAYFVGRAWGRRKLAPAISPGKTLEGAAGGVIGALAYAIICGSFFEGIAWVPFLAAAALLAGLSIVGDLFESAAKRQAGVKDSGALLPGHGGILDRVDSATATLPLAALLWPLMKGNW